MTNQKIIEETIIKKQLRQDKYGKDYLLLELANEETVFVFASKVKPNNWSELQEGKNYEFTIMESKIGSNSLVDFYLNDNTFIY